MQKPKLRHLRAYAASRLAKPYVPTSKFSIFILFAISSKVGGFVPAAAVDMKSRVAGLERAWLEVLEMDETGTRTKACVTVLQARRAAAKRALLREEGGAII